MRPTRSCFEGPLALAGGGVGHVDGGPHVARGAAHEGRHRGAPGGVDRQAAAGAFAGVFLFTVLMVTREGMETALLLLQLKETLHLALGAALGVAGAAVPRRALVAVRPPRESGTLLPGDRHLPVRLRHPVADFRRPRDVGAEPVAVQPGRSTRRPNRGDPTARSVMR